MRDTRSGATTEPVAEQAAPQGAHEPRRLLVVDDNPALRQTAEALFTGDDWQCLTRSDTIGALCAIVEHRPELVMVDIDTGPLDAWHFCLLVREHPDYAGTRIILLCRHEDALIQAKSRAAGADGLLLKPFSAEEVQELLASRGPVAA